jgi:hypothetical protein
MATVVPIRRKLPSDVAACLQKLADHARAGHITAIAFVILLDNRYIADTCGAAHPETLIPLVQALEAKIAKRALRSRR